MATNKDKLVELFNRIANHLVKNGIIIKLKDDDVEFVLNNNSTTRWYRHYSKKSLEDKLRHFLLNENYKMFDFSLCH